MCDDRASHDYGQSQTQNTQQWSELGLSAMLYWAIGLIPFKDDFWSEMVSASGPTAPNNGAISSS